MKDRTIACIYYAAEGQCAEGREGTFWRACQHCDNYQPIAGGRPARKNLKKEKQIEQKKRDLRDTLWN
jgi:hypothetical protein